MPLIKQSGTAGCREVRKLVTSRDLFTQGAIVFGLPLDSTRKGRLGVGVQPSYRVSTLAAHGSIVATRNDRIH